MRSNCFNSPSSSFFLLKTKGTDFLCHLLPEQFVELRAIMIEMILYTDLAKHFEFIAKLKEIRTQHAAATQAAQRGGAGPDGLKGARAICALAESSLGAGTVVTPGGNRRKQCSRGGDWGRSCRAWRWSSGDT